MKNKFLMIACFAMLTIFMVGCPDSTTEYPSQIVKTNFFEEEGGESESYFSFDDTIDDLNWGTLLDMTPSGDTVEEPATPPVITGPQPVVDDPAPVIEEDPAPVVEEDPAPVVEEDPAPVVEDDPAPVIEEDPAPVVEDDPAPVVEEDPAPVVEEDPAPVVEDDPAPVVEEDPAPVVEEDPAPVVEEDPAPAVEEDPDPVVVEPAPVVVEPAPVVEEDPDPVVVEPDPVVEEDPAPTVEVAEEPTPTVEPSVTQGTKMSITKAEFGDMPDGQKVDIYTLTNANGASMKVLTLGGIIFELNVPDKDGNFGNVSANVQSVEDYLSKSPNFGTLVGRYGNRIAAGKYTIDGEEYDHGTNGSPLLHGGRNGFHKVIWDIEELKGDDFVGLTLKLTSDEAHQGFPGTVECVVTYKFNNKNEWEVDYTAVTDKATPINLTQHTYFNLSAFRNATILDEIMMLNADEFIPVDAALIPTGEIASVEGTAMDFRTPTAIGERIDQVGDSPKGYDHCWVLNKGETPNGSTLCAKAVDPTSGRMMEVWTTEPGVQFYTGNFMDGSFGSGDITYVKNSAFCLETQHYPDSPNQPHFPNTILRPGETYRTTTVFKFGVQE